MAARMNAATPITGGIIDPPDEAAASMPPAKTLLTLVDHQLDCQDACRRTLTTGPPVIVPNIAELTIAACAGPPRRCRVAKQVL